jgi:hypothetical protein
VKRAPWRVDPVLSLFALCASLAVPNACRDPRLPTAPSGEMNAYRTSSVARTTQPSVSGYWRVGLDAPGDSAELWLYRNDPEIGMNVHAPSQTRWMHDVGSTLIRQTIYWHNPLAESLDQIAQLVAGAPDGSTILVMLNSKPACVDYNVPGDRERMYRQFTDYVRALAEASPTTGRVQVRYWQIYNEMNMEGWTNMFDGASKFVQGQRYGELLRAVYPAIKAATRDSGFVVMGALGSDDLAGTDVYSATGRYGFVHGMYAAGARDFYDIAAIQPYGRPGLPGLNRASDFDRALAVYGDEARPLWMTEFGSRYTGAQHWSDLREQIDAVRYTRVFSKAFVYVLCAPGDPYSLRLALEGGDECGKPTEAYLGIQAGRYNERIYGADSVLFTDVVIPRPRGDAIPLGVSFVDEGTAFRLLSVPVRHRVPTRIRFARSSSVGAGRVGIAYRAFLGPFGWSDWRGDSSDVGTAGGGVPVHAIQMRIVGGSDLQVRYDVFQRFGWSGWTGDGSIAGDTTLTAGSLRAMLQRGTATATDRTICYALHVVGTGWLAPRCGGDNSPAKGTVDAYRAWLKSSG